MRWRLLYHGKQDGASNMAIDEAIMWAHAEGRVPPTLRFYGWDPPTLSLGYAQKADREVDVEACRRAGVGLVRRPTGGRAVLHEHEVTYSVVISLELLPGSVTETYRQLSRGLVEGLRGLGFPADVQDAAPRTGERTAACFDSPSWYELVVEGKKVVGSAQVRRGGVLLQHGSILLDFEPARVVSLLRVPDENWRARLQRNLAAHAAGLAQLGRACSFEEVARAVAAGFRQGLGVEVEEGELTPWEREQAEKLRHEKYGDEGWTLGKTGG
ncbi:MAG TPA: lipoate--protein ligase family protein [Firmicutes bacterium]|nr:lipoate--protein ligase family protein [Bacillota bacterium]